jgi:hypothetical protein
MRRHSIDIHCRPCDVGREVLSAVSGGRRKPLLSRLKGLCSRRASASGPWVPRNLQALYTAFQEAGSEGRGEEPLGPIDDDICASKPVYSGPCSSFRPYIKHSPVYSSEG